MRIQTFSTTERYWRERYGLPQRIEDRASRHAPWGDRRSIVLRQRLRALRRRWPFTRGRLLKVTALLLFTIWLIGSGIVLLRPASDATPGGDAVFFLVRGWSGREPAPVAASGGVQGSRSHDKLMADFAAANEANLVALRGYLLTESEGFKSEWLKATARLEASVAAVERDSRSWTDGRKLVQLAEVRKASGALFTEQRILASLVGTSNRFPGLRLYREDVEPMLVRAFALCDDTLQSVLASRWAGSAASVDTLARLRGNIGAMRDDLSLYLDSSETTEPAPLRDAYRTFQGAQNEIASLRGKVAPADQTRLDRLAAALRDAEERLGRILALKRTPRWDYADYAFKQKLLPLAERISAIVGEWRAAS